MLQKRGYRVVKACAVDQFPGTLHIETVCLLGNTNRRPDDHLKVNIDVDRINEILDEERNNMKE